MPSSTSRFTKALARLGLVVIFANLLISVFGSVIALAAPINVSQGVSVSATVLGAPPTTQAVILQPVTNARLQTTPLVVRGTCGAGLLVRVYNNGQLAGSITCSVDDDFTMNITLQVGANNLTALNFDISDQSGPVSPAVLVTVDPPAIPATPIEDQPVTGQITREGVLQTSDIPVTTNINGTAGNYQRLFEGTVIEPIAKLLNISAPVTDSVNNVVSMATGGVFMLAIVGVIVLILL